MNSDSQETNFRVQFRDRIPVRIGIGVALVTFGALALALSIINAQDERRFSELHVSEARKIATVIAGDVAKHMLAGGRAAVWSTLNTETIQYVETTGASKIMVVNRKGVVKAASESTAHGTRIKTGNNPQCPKCDSNRPEDFPAVAMFSTPDGVRILRIINPIPNYPACASCHTENRVWRGLVFIDFDLAALGRGEAERRWSMLLIGLAAFIGLAALISLLFKELVMRSITSLVLAAQRLADGDLTARTEVHGKNELSLLARHFNRMAGRIGEQVDRIRAAQIESSLLYTLVVESAKSLETTEMATGVFRVILERLHPDHVAFFLETTDGRWLCATTEQPAGTLTVSEGELETAFASNAAQIGNLLDGLPSKLFSDACRDRTLQLIRNGRDLSFALPLVSDAKLIGMLVCTVDWSKVPVHKELLSHLGANLALAATNSRNYSGAITDSLTRLRNKGYGLVRLDEAVYTSKRYGTSLALAMSDIDFFKRVNDEHGHQAGDVVLKEVSHRIAASIRRSDVAVRYGGEEFMVIIPQASAEEIAAIGEKMRQAIAAAPVEIDAGQAPIAVTLSVGVAAFHAETDNAESLIARADAALYGAKRGGRNRVEIAP